ncbi:SMI1/KNR4 family protein [Cronobacter dublinensis]|uniref:SMI1/KNR4 family protein n=1 Tax=Cronobacter dublinensis TaxID=413497 RepID=UPI00292CCF28|nr:SMI1/KNR4 family protein [Cronobacter dublinensis]WNY83071.1 SMI1/KNR4 family protein [Cronobacter dublinensis]
MQRIVMDSEIGLTQEDFAEVEKKFNWKLPATFKKFYLHHNGGGLTDEYADNEFLLSGFIPFKYGSASIERTYKDLVDDFPTLKEFVPFADDQGGNCFLISMRKKDYGEVYIWLMDEKELAFVIESFDALINEIE